MYERSPDRPSKHNMSNEQILDGRVKRTCLQAELIREDSKDHQCYETINDGVVERSISHSAKKIIRLHDRREIEVSQFKCAR